MQRVVLITGGSGGIGKACVEKFARSGIKVIANYNKSKESAESLQKSLKEEGYEVDIYKADVSKREEIRKMIAWILEKYGKIDILINNARNITNKTVYRFNR
jgi:3-oxoacyl-[acyl-carrier protein] reductase